MGACCSCEFDPIVGSLAPGDMEEEREGSASSKDGGSHSEAKGAPPTASVYSQQGWKGINQDSMFVWEDFAGDEDSSFCGVFDGHGPLGHKVSWFVRDSLPPKLQPQWKPLESPSPSPTKADVDSSVADKSKGSSTADGVTGDHQAKEWFRSWHTSLENAFEEMDNELGAHPTIDCICSGATAVTVLKQKEHLIIANLGDSRAVLCTRDMKNHLVPVQLTVDQKPNVPGEAERISSRKGRVFSLEEEPDVHRVWLPDEDCPGLAMARAFGDFCLKDFGLISTPQISYRKISDKDEFVVLATDGVWDVLSNKEVIKIVSSAIKKSDAAKLLVKRAVRAWRSKCPTSKVDDCTAVCLFLKPPPPASAGTPRNRNQSRGADPALSSGAESFGAGQNEVPSESDQASQQQQQAEWTALNGMARWNTMTKKTTSRLLLARGLSRRKSSRKAER